ncbi:ABC transporter permease, partial [Streptomyces sp. NPDC059697]
MGLTAVVSTLLAVLAGLLTTAVTGPSAWGAACAVCLAGWTPYAAQGAALLEQERASGHMLASIFFGTGRWHLLRRHLLSAVPAPVHGTGGLVGLGRGQIARCPAGQECPQQWTGRGGRGGGGAPAAAGAPLGGWVGAGPRPNMG